MDTADVLAEDAYMSRDAGSFDDAPAIVQMVAISRAVALLGHSCARCA
jgi:hypothetical protein